MVKLEEVISLGNREGGSLFRRNREAGQAKEVHKDHYSYIGFDLMMRCQQDRMRDGLGWRAESVTESTFHIVTVGTGVRVNKIIPRVWRVYRTDQD